MALSPILKDVLASQGWHLDRIERIKEGNKSRSRAWFRHTSGKVALFRDALWSAYEALGMPSQSSSSIDTDTAEISEDEKEQLRLQGLY